MARTLSKKALAEQIELANQGNLDAIKRVAADYYYQGDIKLALEWWEKAGNLGVIYCAVNCYAIYEQMGNTEKVLEWLEKSAELGDADSQYLLGSHYNDLFNTTFNSEYIESAREWWEKAAAQNEPDSAGGLAQYYFGRAMFDQSVYWGEKALKDGLNGVNKATVKTKLDLAKIHLKVFDDIDIAPDSKEKLTRQEQKKFFEFYIEHVDGFPHSKIVLCSCYRLGLGVKKDIAQAIHWGELAVQSDDNEISGAAQVNLAFCYLEQKDPVKAVYYFEQAAQKGELNSLLNLGVCYLCEEKIKDVQKAIQYYERAAQNGKDLALFNLAVCYAREESVKDVNKANYYFEQAAKKCGDSFLVSLGAAYAELELVKDPKKSVYYFEQALAKGLEIDEENLALYNQLKQQGY
ncbi:tetratricopeptide repeat protein [Lonepinella sp. BR2904]|uniref:SEL1-like repeat protein n=1 Tax=Lonepinella sp. BR2904 TaxID=3434551 RepID=UPI003F6DD169